MKRTIVLGVLALAALVSRAEAQLAMQMSNGWTFTFAGNVNAFYIYNTTKTQTAPGTFTTTSKNSGIGTGLLPAFATFEAKGKEGNTDLSVYFGFAPQVSAGNGFASFFGPEAAGAQIDMRQVYLTAGGKWGSILAGKQLGVYQRSNIIEDMTIFGLGPGGANRGTSLGRIGYGYEYTDFRPQMTYTSVGGKPASFSIGLFSPLSYGPYSTLELPRVEADFNWSNAAKKPKTTFYFDISGFVQNVKDGVTGTTHSVTPTGVAGTVKVGFSSLTLVGSGYYTTGGCSLFMADAGLGSAGVAPCDGIGTIADASGKFNTRNSYGWYGQAVFAPKGSNWIFGGSYGGNYLKENDEDKANVGNLTFSRRNAIIGQITYKWTKSLRVVAEYTYFDSHFQSDFVAANPGASSTADKSNQGAVGFMLFY
jgi:hypothetical protein